MPDASVAELIRGRSVITQRPQSSVREAACAMANHRIGALPIVETRHLIGIFTERDLVTRVVAVGRDPDNTRVEHVMTRRPETVSIDCPLEEALEVMLSGRFRHLPVMAGGEVVGVISLRDIGIQYHGQQAPEANAMNPILV